MSDKLHTIVQSIIKAFSSIASCFTCSIALLTWLLLGVCSLSSLLLGGEGPLVGMDRRIQLAISLVFTIGPLLFFVIPFWKAFIGADKPQEPPT